MRVIRIEPLGSLTSEERMLLDEMLVEHPEIAPESLVVYVVTRGTTAGLPPDLIAGLPPERRLIAPRTDEVVNGSLVLIDGFESARPRRQQRGGVFHQP